MVWSVAAAKYEEATNFQGCFSAFKTNVHACLKTEDENGSCVEEHKIKNKECLAKLNKTTPRYGDD